MCVNPFSITSSVDLLFAHDFDGRPVRLCVLSVDCWRVGSQIAGSMVL